MIAPLRSFLNTEASGGILLLAAAVVALIWANSPWSATYHALWETPLVLSFADYRLSTSLHAVVNEGLMALFFFVVGLEIKREVLIGELVSLRRALLPLVAAVGGALVPAVIYLAFNAGGDASVGWGIPMATDIAFALGVLALLGSRVPLGLKIFVTALAIADDLLAIGVIAIFYSGDLWLPALGGAAAILLLLIGANRLNVRSYLPYALLGIALWAAVLLTGVHATIAGVLLALTVPASTRIDGESFLKRAGGLLEDFAQGDHPKDVRRSGERQSALSELEDATEAIQTPLQRMEHNLHPWVAYLVVPIFALSNAGVSLSDGLGAAVTSPIAYGVVLGLVLGKPIGILGFSWLVIRLGWSALPARVAWRHLAGAGLLAGIGFTMSLFIGELAFAAASDRLEVTKVAILVASVVAAIAGWLVLRSAPPRPDPRGRN